MRRLGKVADRLLGLVAPEATAAACGGEWESCQCWDGSNVRTGAMWCNYYSDGDGHCWPGSCSACDAC